MKKRGVEVIVVCDDKDVEEYATQHVDERRVTSYIASEIGKVMYAFVFVWISQLIVLFAPCK